MFRAECPLTDGASDRNRPCFRRMVKLPMAAFGPGDAPALLLKALDYIADFHTSRIVRNYSTGGMSTITQAWPSVSTGEHPIGLPGFLRRDRVGRCRV